MYIGWHVCISVSESDYRLFGVLEDGKFSLGRDFFLQHIFLRESGEQRKN